MASIRAQLSPREESTFRRIVLGVSGAEELRAEDVTRLAALGLIKAAGGQLTVTEGGMLRYRDEPQPPVVRPLRPRRLKSRILPF